MQRALAAERRLAAQLGAPSPPVPDSAVVNAGYGGQGMSERVASYVIGASWGTGNECLHGVQRGLEIPWDL